MLEEKAAMEEEAAAREQAWQWREREWKREMEREREARRLETARDMQMMRVRGPERESVQERESADQGWDGKEKRGIVSGDGEKMGMTVEQASDRHVRQSADTGTLGAAAEEQQGIGETAVVGGEGSCDERRQRERERDANAGDCSSGEGQQQAPKRQWRQQGSETSGERRVYQHSERGQSPESGKACQHIEALSTDVFGACKVVTDVVFMCL